MFLDNFSPFTRMIMGATIGIAAGIVLGLFFGLIIVIISTLISQGTLTYIGSQLEMGTFAGMGIGAVIGALMGGFAANKK